MPLHFTKMHGLGNDFVVLDRRGAQEALDRRLVHRMGDRHRGIGFDQLLTIEANATETAPLRYGVWNTDGSEAGQCGNGARALVAWLARAGQWPGGVVRMQAPDAVIEAERFANGSVRVNMGVPDFRPAALPFLIDAQALSYELIVGADKVEIGAVSMGNPHMVLTVPDVEHAPVAVLGPLLEQHARFPQRCNVGFAQLLSPASIRLRVYERGVGETQACGSGACAAVAVLAQRGLLAQDVEVTLPGGTLALSWQGPGAPIWMRGPAEFVFDGEWLA